MYTTDLETEEFFTDGYVWILIVEGALKNDAWIVNVLEDLKFSNLKSFDEESPFFLQIWLRIVMNLRPSW